MAEVENRPPKQKMGPGMLLLYTLGAIAVTAWGVIDGWFRGEGYEHATFSRYVAAGGLIAAIYCFVMLVIRWKETPESLAGGTNASLEATDEPPEQE